MKVAVVGATGLVGGEILKVLAERNFPVSEMKDYIKKSPDARNRVIAARTIIAGSTAQNVIMPGDIIWAVNNK